MGKRKDIPGSTEEESISAESPSSSHKKHKKHKKKHKKKKDRDLEESFESTSDSTPVKPAIRLKLKIGGETLATKDITPALEDNSSNSIPIDEPVINVTDTTPWEVCLSEGDKADDTFHAKKSGEDTSDEEKQWLDALEAGELDDYGEVKKNANTKPLTTRQKALLHGQQENELLQLPSGYKTVELTEEQLQRRQQRAKKRRIQAQEKREKDKKLTLDRLLKKQDSRAKKGRGSKRSNIPRVRYSLKRDGNTISIPQGFHLPFTPQPPRQPPKPVKCGVKGCTNNKLYSCSKTGLPLCSLGCYKNNLALHETQTGKSIK